VVELLGLICCLIPVFGIGVLIQAAIFRFAARLVGAIEISWPMAAITVVAASIVQSVFTGIFFGADFGLCGSICAFLVWTGVLGGLTELDWGQAMIVGLIMIFVGWLLGLLFVGIAVMAGATALLGAAGLAAVGA